MSKLEELIKEYCPNGVEYKAIGELCTLNAGGDVPKDAFSTERTEEFQIPIYSNGIGDNALYGYTNKAKVSSPCVTISARGTIGWSALRTEPFYPVVRLIYVIPNDELLADFLKYSVERITFKVPQSGIPQLTVPMVSKYKIPVPPLPVQREIVRILDNFTNLTAELTKELAARKKQYEYYRNQLLQFDSQVFSSVIKEVRPEDVVYKSFGDVVTFLNGRAYKRSELLDKGKYKVLRVGNFYSNDKWYYSDLELEENKYCDNGDLLYSWAATLGPKIWDEGKVIFHYHIWKLEFDETVVDKRYLYYFMQKDVEEISNSITNSTMPHVSMDSMKKRILALPPLPVQRQIRDVLDRFDALCHDLTSGLPAEIAARQKQYEYYRDKLLTFKPLS